MITPYARSNHHVRDPQVVRDVGEGFLFSLTFSAAFVADLSGQLLDRHAVVDTPAATVVLIALIWSIGRYLHGRSATGRRRLTVHWDGNVPWPARRAGAYPWGGAWMQFMLRDEPRYGASDNRVCFLLTSGSACLLGGLLPLIPYLYLWSLSRTTALLLSVVLTVGALSALGAATAHVAGLSVGRSAVQALVVGGGLTGIMYVLIIIARLLATT